MQRDHGWVGRKDRNGIDVDAIVLRQDGAQVNVKLTNVSAEGCCLQSDETFRIGEQVSIALPRVGDVRARVRWALPGAAGTQFLDGGSD
jgi:PilZ domain